MKLIVNLILIKNSARIHILLRINFEITANLVLVFFFTDWNSLNVSSSSLLALAVRVEIKDGWRELHNEDWK